MDGPLEWVPLTPEYDPKPVSFRGFKRLSFFIHRTFWFGKPVHREWTVSECKSGHRVGRARVPRKAIADAAKVLRKHGMKETEKQIKSQLSLALRRPNEKH